MESEMDKVFFLLANNQKKMPLACFNINLPFGHNEELMKNTHTNKSIKTKWIKMSLSYFQSNADCMTNYSQQQKKQTGFININWTRAGKHDQNMYVIHKKEEMCREFFFVYAFSSWL